MSVDRYVNFVLLVIYEKLDCSTCREIIFVWLDCTTNEILCGHSSFFVIKRNWNQRSSGSILTRVAFCN